MGAVCPGSHVLLVCGSPEPYEPYASVAMAVASSADVLLGTLAPASHSSLAQASATSVTAVSSAAFSTVLINSLEGKSPLQWRREQGIPKASRPPNLAFLPLHRPSFPTVSLLCALSAGQVTSDRGREGGRKGENLNVSLTIKMKSHNWNEQKITETLQIPAKECKDALGLIGRGGKQDGCRSGIAQNNCQGLTRPAQLLHRQYFCVLSPGGPHASPSAPTLPLPPSPTSLQPPPKPSSPLLCWTPLAVCLH